MIFGVCVLAEHGYVPIGTLELDDLQLVRDMLTRNTTCPQRFIDALTQAFEAFLETCPYCGLKTPTPCDSLPSGLCEHALNATYATTLNHQTTS